MNSQCPICGIATCKGYEYMWSQFALGINRNHWLKVHEDLNNSPGDPMSEDIARLAALVSEEYRNNAKTTNIPFMGRCCG